MKNLKLTLIIGCFTLIASHIFSQTGEVSGLIIDQKSKLSQMGVKVMAVGTAMGCVSDVDGKYNMKLPVGNYKLVFSSLFYDTVVIENVEVKNAQKTSLPTIEVAEKVIEVDEVTVTAVRRENSEVAVLSMKKNASNAIDGISAATIKKAGDSDAASAISRVSGVSIAEGKYVYIRGIGDRYNKILLNGMEIPALDPDKNAFQIDLIPTNIIENIIINKSFIAEIPGNFAGGVVDIHLQNFPNQKQGNVSVSVGYNPNYHFNKNYLTQQKSGTDFLGFDDGLRTIPAENNIPFYVDVISNSKGQKAKRYQEVIGNFGTKMAAIQSMSLMDFGLSASFGNQKKMNESTLGYHFNISYDNKTSFFQDVEFGRYGLHADPTVKEMEMRSLQTGSFGVNNVLLNSMIGIGLRTKKSKIALNLLHIQNGESKSGVFDYLGNNQGSNFNAFQHNLEYTQRSMTYAQLLGNHDMGKNENWDLEWKIAPTLSIIKNPDIRFTRYRVEESGYSIGTETGFPERIWRNLREINLAGDVNATWNFKWNERNGKIKFGGGHIYKNREYNIRSFIINTRNVPLTGNPDELFTEENLWPYNDDISKGTTIEATFLPNNPNHFFSNVNKSSGFVSSELPFSKIFKTIIGVRVENYMQQYTGRDQLGYHILNNDLVLNELKVLPSANFIFEINKKQNIRVAYGKTVARPSFKELSYAEIVDPLTGITFIGGLFEDKNNSTGEVYWDGNLRSSDIHNFDLRWEIFPSLAQSISVSAFYKKFINPIEIIQFATQDGSYQPRNVGEGEVFGGELDAIFSLQFISEKMKDFSMNFNATYAYSRIKFSQTEKESRIANAREGQIIGDYRSMSGQAPYVLNAGISYNGGENGFWNGLQIGLFYNVQGPTLTYVGMVDRPDVYTVPFHNMKLNISKLMGKKQQWKVGFKISNLLNDKRELVYKSYQAKDQLFSSMKIGTTMSLKISYLFK